MHPTLGCPGAWKSLLTSCQVCFSAVKAVIHKDAPPEQKAALPIISDALVREASWKEHIPCLTSSLALGGGQQRLAVLRQSCHLVVFSPCVCVLIIYLVKIPVILKWPRGCGYEQVIEMGSNGKAVTLKGLLESQPLPAPLCFLLDHMFHHDVVDALLPPQTQSSSIR